MASSLAKASVNAGADIVKFQCHIAESESSSDEAFRVKFSLQDSSRWEYWKRTSFSLEQWRILKEQVEENGAIFGVSVFSKDALLKMLHLEVKFLKIGSGDLLNLEIREALEDFTGTLVLSTGLATWDEVKESATWMKKWKFSEDSAILQCTSKYPTELGEVGLNVMRDIRSQLQVNSGLSDHTKGINSSIAAISAGARYVAKHVVISREMFGPDVSSSIDFQEFNNLKAFRDDFKEINKPVNKDSMAEQLKSTRELFGRSLGLVRNFSKGEVPLDTDFNLKKPAGGLKWEDRAQFAGKSLAQDYNISQLLSIEHFSKEP
jgi:N-acetylneuraminate synthase